MATTATIQAMLRNHPEHGGAPPPDLLVRAIRDLSVCEQACVQCADACIGERAGAEMDHCIQTDLACADACAMARRVLSRRTGQDARLVAVVAEVCEELCGICAAECERHAGHMAHCAECAVRCRACAETCRELLLALA